MDLIERRAAIEILATMQGLCTSKAALVQNSKIWQQIKDLPSAEPKPIWHDCDPTDKNTLPEPGSWAIWCDKEGHKIIARWKEDAIDHFWPDQRMFDFNLEDAVAWTEIPKRL